MKTIRFFIALLAVVLMAGCASTTSKQGGGLLQENRDAVTGAVAGGFIGGAAAGNAGAVAVGLLGTGIGVLSDAQNRKDNERAEKTNAILQQRGAGVGSSDMETVRTDAQTDANLAFAQRERNNCEVEFAKEKKAGMNPVYICKQVFEAAYAEAKTSSRDASPILYGSSPCGDVVRRGSRHERFWLNECRTNQRVYRQQSRYGYRRY